MTPHALLFTLAAIGIAETVYLIRSRLASVHPVCPIGGESCNLVLTSRYSRIFGVSNDILGVIFYFAVGIVAAFLVIGVGPLTILDNVIKIAVTLATLLSLYFTYLQAHVLKRWCFWCLMSAITIWAMALILLTNKLI